MAGNYDGSGYPWQPRTPLYVWLYGLTNRPGTKETRRKPRWWGIRTYDLQTEGVGACDA